MPHDRDMRQPADWMVRADDRILETLRDEGNMTAVAVSRDGLRERVDIGRKYASDRLNALAEYGLLERLDRGLYGITEDGRAYLDEELDASELEPRGENES